MHIFIYIYTFMYIDLYRPIYPSLDLSLYIVGRLIPPLPMPPLCRIQDDGG